MTMTAMARSALHDPVLPHRPPLRLITAVGRDGAAIHAQAVVPSDSPAAADGWVRSGYLVEIAAQAAAAGEADHGGDATRVPMHGMLTAVRGWRQHAPVAAGTVIEVTVVREAELGEAARFAAELRSGGILIASGSLQVVRKPACV